MHAFLYLTQVSLDLEMVNKLIAWNYFLGEMRPLKFVVPTVSELNQNWSSLQTRGRVMVIDSETKKDMQKLLMGVFQRYSEPTLLFLGNLADYSESLQESLLKLLEEPPRNLIIILYSEVRSDVLPTISSRCQIFGLTTQLVIKHLDTNLQTKVTKKLPSVQESTKLLISGVEPKVADIAKIERDEIDFWLWQIGVNLEYLYAQNPSLIVANVLEKVLTTRQLNRQNLQKKFALGWLKV
jgi:DNA polymerase III delta prime subunit